MKSSYNPFHQELGTVGDTGIGCKRASRALMRNKSHFQFKKFTISHARSTMKVGTDTVLLGAWLKVDQAQSILDIGTGNGTIALMLAQRSLERATIDAVEIEAADVMQAEENFQKSPWNNKIQLHHTSIQNFFPKKKV